MSLMDAGVPVKEIVAGVAMDLLKREKRLQYLPIS